MKKKKHDPRKFAEELVTSLCNTFVDVYRLHANGMTETELLIQHDIYAAASEHAQVIKDAHRKALKSAVAAVDEHVPMPVALVYMRRNLHRKMEELLREGA
jgi:hypothetical protein